MTICVYVAKSSYWNVQNQKKTAPYTSAIANGLTNYIFHKLFQWSQTSNRKIPIVNSCSSLISIPWKGTLTSTTRPDNPSLYNTTLLEAVILRGRITGDFSPLLDTVEQACRRRQAGLHLVYTGSDKRVAVLTRSRWYSLATRWRV